MYTGRASDAYDHRVELLSVDGHSILCDTHEVGSDERRVSIRPVGSLDASECSTREARGSGSRGIQPRGKLNEMERVGQMPEGTGGEGMIR